VALPLVLVHGGAHGAWCWSPTQAWLEAPSIAVDLPPVSMRGGEARHDVPPEADDLHLADFAAAVLAAADAAPADRFVLVGHSLAGLTLIEVARTAPARVAHLVFVSALVPPEGRNAVDALPPEMLERVANGLDEDAIRYMFCNDMNEAQAAFVLDHVGGEVMNVMVEPVTCDGLPATMPITYVRLARDQGLIPAAQDASIARLRELAPVSVVELDTGHNVMISDPPALAVVLDEVAAAAR